MSRKKSSSSQNQPTKTDAQTPQTKQNREDKILNVIVNTSVLLMSTMMGAFTQVMVKATDAMASGMAEALDGKEASDQVNKEMSQNLPQVDEKMKAMISDIRKDIYSQLEQKKQEFDPLLSDPIFELGPKIIEKYDFKLPKLTQKLDDTTLTQYSQLLTKEDPNFTQMFKELVQWMNSLPKPPTTTNNEKIK